MAMDGWQDRLHFSFINEHVLFTGLRLDSFASFFLASILTVVICLFERFLTLLLTKHWTPSRSVRHSRVQNALWRAGVYWVVTLLRLYVVVARSPYILSSMTMITSPRFDQPLHAHLDDISCWNASRGQPDTSDGESPRSPSANSASSISTDRNLPCPVGGTLHLRSPTPSSANTPSSPPSSSGYRPINDDPTYSRSPMTSLDKPRSPPSARPRAKSKSKPADIFIHPNHSNIARADAAAVEMGIHGDTDRVKANVTTDDGDAWVPGKGRALARELLLGSTAHSRRESQSMLFRIQDDESDDGRDS
ncbi:hypothetical protein EW146_g869 [Bondarzewia mesenterica]|uniref:Copper transporter n=1 Tax=Bondarzewia mesenterica TaxID=1095465 RepID=A0A4S4M5K0_9AGAM|nr:hypothetical protein EW146_g869 [Bondarzewia mesenterica]